jgi:hypothetical protein
VRAVGRRAGERGVGGTGVRSGICAGAVFIVWVSLL